MSKTKVNKTYEIVQRGNDYMPAMVSEKTGKVIKLFRDLANESKEAVESAASNKALCYLFWKEGIEDIESLHRAVNGDVKKTTIQNWVRGWEDGKRLPAIAKD